MAETKKESVVEKVDKGLKSGVSILDSLLRSITGTGSSNNSGGKK